MNLYWCTTPDHDEDWFVVAATAEEAGDFHELAEGYNEGDANVELVCEVPKAHWPDEAEWPGEELLLACGAEILREESPRLVRIGDRTYGEGMLDAELMRKTDDILEARGQGRPNETVRELARAGAESPAWFARVQAALDEAVELFAPGPFQIGLTEESEVVCAPCAMRVEGGQDDGEEVFSPFSIDLGAVAKLFDEPPGMSWCTGPADPEVILEGVIDGQEVVLRILSMPPDSGRPSYSVDRRGRIRPIDRDPAELLGDRDLEEELGDDDEGDGELH